LDTSSAFLGRGEGVGVHYQNEKTTYRLQDLVSQVQNEEVLLGWELREEGGVVPVGD
jgi:hypothetical protein